MAWAQTGAPLIEQTLNSISPEQIQLDAEILVGVTPYNGSTIRSRDIYHPNHELAVQYLTDRMEQGVFDVWFEDFWCSSPPCNNLIIEIPGYENPDTIWIVGAHFDSTNGENSDAPAPGAVDNASGTIIVLAALDALIDSPFKDTIRFILFDAEENGFLGSRAHAQNAADKNESIELMINLDVPGYRFMGLDFAFANSDFPTWPAMQEFAQIPNRYDIGSPIIAVPAPELDASDHASFWDEGFPAFIVGSLYSLTPWMNTGQDTFNKLDLVQTEYMARAVTAYLAEQAGILSEHPLDPQDDDDNANDDDDDDSGTDDDDDDDSINDDSDTSTDDDDDSDAGCCG
jgi:hypothetical protein